jgi:LacI family transcriptional regulator
VINANYDIESGRQGAKQLLGNVSAIFAFNDLQAYGVMDAAREMNMVIPRDVSLVGFDDIFYSAVLDMRLTTVSQPIKEMAKELCFLMIKAIEDDEPISNEISIPGKLVRRDSVAKFRSING